jgi:hypothetical protein
VCPANPFPKRGKRAKIANKKMGNNFANYLIYRNFAAAYHKNVE